MRILSSLLLLIASGPARAAEAAVPEPSSSALFLLGVAGLIVGRQAAKCKRRDRD